MTAANPNPTPLDGEWPELPLASWKDTYATLHMWTQIVGKLRLAFTPLVNHYWNVTLHLGATGLTTGAIPHRSGVFEVNLDFVDHQLTIAIEDGRKTVLPLVAQPVADFYRALMDSLHALGIEAKIWPMPVEIPDPVRFDRDLVHASYDPEFANRFWRVLVKVDAVLTQFRSRFIGKCSPVHFFWGSFDHAVTRFSGRVAPERKGADPITREAYSHEVISAGFWPGSGSIAGAAFYCYAAPEPAGFGDSPVKPKAARYDRQLNEFVLMYDDVRSAVDPASALLDFLQSTYEAGANLGNWDRKALERQPE